MTKYALPLVRLALAVAVSALLVRGSAAEPSTRPPPRPPSQVPAADFFRAHAVDSVEINPAGTHVAFTVYDEKTDTTGLRIVDLKTHKASGFNGSQEYNVNNFGWVDNERIVFSVIWERFYASGLHMVRLGDLEHPWVLNENDYVVVLGEPRHRPNRLIVWPAGSSRHYGGAGPAVELDLTRKFRQGFDVDYSNTSAILQLPKDVHPLQWLLDREGEVTYVHAVHDKVEHLYRREANGSWRQLSLDLDADVPLGVDRDPAVIYVAERNASGGRDLVTVNTDTGARGPVLISEPKYDLSMGGLLHTRDGRETIGLHYIQRAPVTVWFRPKDAAIQDTLDAALPRGHVNVIVSRSEDDTKLVVISFSDRHPGSFYLFDTKTRNLSFLTSRAPWLQEAECSPTKMISIPTRDGLTLEGYLTLPHATEPATLPPLIVLPHGGPWYRDTWSYDSEVQFFASRGYAVLQPNYRGSTGYADIISEKFKGDFRKMHDDVTDAARLVAKSGLVDPKRIAIVGSSFGGYLAVCGAEDEPDLYKCAVTVAGVFDWEQMAKEVWHHDPDSIRYDRLVRDIGDPTKEKDKFAAISPINRADKIRMPVFVAHGEFDFTVDSGESHRLAHILEKTGVPLETMFEAHEAHGFSQLKNEVELYERIESFLKKHL